MGSNGVIRVLVVAALALGIWALAKYGQATPAVLGRRRTGHAILRDARA